MMVMAQFLPFKGLTGMLSELVSQWGIIKLKGLPHGQLDLWGQVCNSVGPDASNHVRITFFRARQWLFR